LDYIYYSKYETSWNTEDVFEKEARGVGDFELGVVKDVSDDYVITEQGLIDKDRFYIQKSRILHTHGQVVWFWITKKM